MKSLVKQRKLGFWDILGEGAGILSFKFKEIFVIALGSGLAYFAYSIYLQGISAPGNKAPTLAQVLLGLVLLLLLGLIMQTAYMSIAIITEGVADNRPLSLAEALHSAASRWWKALVTSLLADVILIGLTLLFVIPGMIYSIYYVFALYVVALRDKQGKAALDYSKKLVEGQWWRVFGILLGISLLPTLAYAIIGYWARNATGSSYVLLGAYGVLVTFSMLLRVMYVVLFLNNDFVYQRRIAGREARASQRALRRNATIEEYLASRRTGVQPAPAPAKRAARKTSPKKQARKTGAARRIPRKTSNAKKTTGTPRKKATTG